METVKAKANAFVDSLNDQLSENKYAKLAEEKTGVKAGLLALGVGFTVAMLTLLVCGQEFFTEAAAFFPPAFLTLLDMHNKSIDVPFWMTYWLIFGLLNVIEDSTAYVEEIPLYFWIKLVFLAWCFHSTTKGSTLIYNNVLEKFCGASEAAPSIEKPESEPLVGGGQVPDEVPEEDSKPMTDNAEDEEEEGEI